MNKTLLTLLMLPLIATAQEDIFAGKGVILSESGIANPKGNTQIGIEADCYGPAFGVTTANANGTDNFVFGADGKPCTRAETLWNGDNPADRRAPAPSIHIGFTDELGTQPRTTNTQIPSITQADFAKESLNSDIDQFSVSDALPELSHTATHNGLDIAQKARKWEVLKESERLLSDIRQVGRFSNEDLIDAHQNKIIQLQSKLRDLETENARLNNQSLDKQLTADELQRKLSSRSQNWQVQENHLLNEREELQRRLSLIEQKNAENAQEAAARERTLQTQVAQLEQSVTLSEGQANKARRELVLEAAQKIAEAERLAFAARLAEKQAISQEAARKRAESDVLLERALSLKEGKTVLVPGISDILGERVNPIPVPFEQLPVAVHADNVTLQKLLENVLKQAAKHAGDWRVSWQLSPAYQYVLQETWSLTAEATVGEILAFIQTRLKETHNLDVTFERFDKVKLLVASDGADTAIQQ